MPKNKLIIVWRDNSPSSHSKKNESLRCTSKEGAEKILSKRPKNELYFAEYFNGKGEKEVFNFNTKTITVK